MARDYSTAPRTAVRRQDREVKDERWIADFLDAVPTVTIGTVLDGQPFLNVNIFKHDRERHAIYIHTGREGRLRANAESDSRCCLSFFTMGRILPAPTARNFSVEYASVVVFGRISVVEEESEKTAALLAINARYAPHLVVGLDYSGVTAADLRDTTLFRVDIEEWSGKRKVAPEDAPGAFRVPVPDVSSIAPETAP